MVRLCFFVFVSLAISSIDAAAITNEQLLDLLRENSESDVKEYLIPNADGKSVETDDEDDSVIDLPGDPEDEADIETLVDKLGLLDINEDTVRAPDDPLVGGGCSCSKDRCTCCIGKTITIRMGFKKIRTSIHACVTARYLPGSTNFVLTFTLNGKTAYHKTVSLARPPKVCVKMSASLIKAYVCLDIYNVNIGNKSLCTRLIGVIDFRVKKLYFKWGIACFKIPTLSPDWLANEQQTLPSAEPLMADDDVTI